MQRTANRNNIRLLFHRLSHSLLMALFAFPLLPLPATNILFILFSSVVLFYWIYIDPQPVWKNIRFNALLILPFIPYLIELLFYPQSATIAFEFEKKLPFFIAPFSIPVFLRLSGRRNAMPYFKVFAAAMIAISIYSIAMLIFSANLFNAAVYDNGNYLLRYHFEAISHLHPTYYGLFAAAATGWALYGFEGFASAEKIVFGTGAALMFVLCLLIAARMPLLILFGGIFYVFYLKVRDRKKLAMLYSILVVFIALLYFVVPSLKSRFSELNSTSVTTTETNTIRQRRLIFDCSTTIFLDHLLGGTGARNAQQALDHCYQSKNASMESYKYNAHNQYLTLGINYGIFILLLFLFAIAVLIKHSIHNKFGLFLFAALLLIMLTESILERQMGIYFFLLFALVTANSGLENKEIDKGNN